MKIDLMLVVILLIVLQRDKVGDEVVNAGREVLSDENSVQNGPNPGKKTRKRNRSFSEQSTVCTIHSADASLSASQLTGLENLDLHNLSFHSQTDFGG